MNSQSLRERRIEARDATDAGHETGRAASSQDRAVSPAGNRLLIPDVTLPEFVLERAAIRAHRRALIEAGTGRVLTYGELAAAVREIGGGLLAHGVRPRDVVVLCAPNSLEFVLTWYAATSVGAIVSPVNPQWTRDEIHAQLKQTAAKWLVAPGSLIEQKLFACLIDTHIAGTFAIGGGGTGTIPFDALREAPQIQAQARIESTDTAYLPTSSGTTGLPKSVLLTHRSLVASLCQMRYAQHVEERDVVIAAVPLFHIFGLQVALNLPLRAGATVVILPRFEIDSFVRAVRDYGVTRAELVPPMLRALATHEGLNPEDLSSLRVLTSAAAPLSPEIARTCARRIGCRVKQAYGMTELGGGTHIAPDVGPDRPESIGPALPGVECRLIDPETGADLPPGQPGELLVRSPSTMSGYLGNPQATAATIDPTGWVHTGDIVTVDAQGWYVVTDRLKELIKYKGWQVAPAELEGILLMHPAVADAAVVRQVDAAAGETPKAFVVLRSPASASELMSWVAARAATYKQLHHVEFIDRIPRSPAGKILRRLLVEGKGACDMSAQAAANDATRNHTGSAAGAHFCDGESSLKGKVVVVTGGGRGLGRLLASSLARAGAAVALIARSATELETAVSEIRHSGGIAIAAQADLANGREAAAALTHVRECLGRLDVLINNAGICGPVGPMWEVDATEWWKTFEINVGASFLASRLVLPGMIEARQGIIINMASYAGIYRWPLVSAYSASKAALTKLSENLAAETRRYGIAVFSVDPGLLPIGLSAPALKSTADETTSEGRFQKWIRDQLATGHGADPEQAARLVLALASGRANRLSGRHVTVRDSIDVLLAHIDRIEREDLQTLRLRTA